MKTYKAICEINSKKTQILILRAKTAQSAKMSAKRQTRQTCKITGRRMYARVTVEEISDIRDAFDANKTPILVKA